MSHQINYQKVSIKIIKPLERHYGKPFDPETIDDYVKDFGRFNEDTLEAAMSEVRESYTKSFRPAPGVIFQAIRKVQGDGRSGSSDCLLERQRSDDARFSRIKQATDDYVSDFRRDNRARIEALQPKYMQMQIIDCVYQAALYQMQIIEEKPNCAYGSAGWHSPKGENSKERLSWWLNMCKTNARGGVINVEVPWVWFEPQEVAA